MTIADASPAPREAASRGQLPEIAAVMAKARRENFPVATRLLPRDARAHLLAIYGFARLVDDAGDESGGDRLDLLEAIEAELGRAFAGGATHPVFVALQPTIVACRLAYEPFHRLIDANRLDQVKRRYDTMEDLLAYCGLSANPVGELVLAVFDAATPARIALSDAVCSGLQLTEHWQDVVEDDQRGRIYLPRADRDRFGVREADLARPTPTPALRALLAFEVGRARALLTQGAPLIGELSGRPALAVALFIAGGRAALRAIARADYDVVSMRPRPTRRLLAASLLETLLRSAGR